VGSELFRVQEIAFAFFGRLIWSNSVAEPEANFDWRDWPVKSPGAR